jgi:hypothetical protein
MSLRRRPPLRPSALIAVGLVLFMLVALGPAQILGVRETAKRTQCISHLEQLGLAVHNYHDANFQLPPLATDEGHWTWTALLLPYLEEDAVYKKIDLVEPAKSEKNKEVVAAFKMPLLLCPSRRTKAARKEGEFKGGQPTDYVAVSTTSLKKYSVRTDGAIIYRAQAPTKDGLRLRSSTTFGSVTDGLSNTAMIGEKHMLKDWLEGKYDEPALVALNDQNTIRIASTVEKDKPEDKEVEKLRGLAVGDKDKDDWKFGSAHLELCQFVLCDASVRVLKNSTDPKILKALGTRHGGERIEVP